MPLTQSSDNPKAIRSALANGHFKTTEGVQAAKRPLRGIIFLFTGGRRGTTHDARLAIAIPTSNYLLSKSIDLTII